MVWAAGRAGVVAAGVGDRVIASACGVGAAAGLASSVVGRHTTFLFLPRMGVGRVGRANPTRAFVVH